MTEWLRFYWARVVAGLALAVVAGVTGRVSYFHIESLTLALHQPPMVAQLMPFGVDGLIVVGSVVLLQAIPGQDWLGWLGVGPGVAASVFANVESGIRYGWLAAGWAGVPAVSFALATFLLERWLKAQVGRGGRGGRRGAGIQDVNPDILNTAGQCSHGVAMTVDDAILNAYSHALECLGETPSRRQLAASFGQSRDRVAKLVDSLNGTPPQMTP